MSVIQRVENTSDCVSLFNGQHLYLKPLAKLNVSVQLPQLHKTSNSKLSNWEVMERLKSMVKPHTFSSCKVSKSSIEFIRFDVELETASVIDTVIGKLDCKSIKLSGFPQSLKVRAAEAKQQNYPRQEDWEAFFTNDCRMKDKRLKDQPGHRPDTVYICNLPTKWFLNRQDRSGLCEEEKPSVSVIRKTFSAFGDVRQVDVPSLDPYRSKMNSSSRNGTIAQFSYDQDVLFDAFIQYSEYIGFVRAMNELRGMKLLYKDKYDNKAWSAAMKVDFDRNAHLSVENIKKRERERERLVREEQEEERRQRELRLNGRDNSEGPKIEEQRERDRRRAEREERRRRRFLDEAQRGSNNNDEKTDKAESIAKKIALEERKLVVAQRKLEAIRLIDELIKRVKQSTDRVQTMETEILMTAAKESQKGRDSQSKATNRRLSQSKSNEIELRYKLIAKMKRKEQKSSTTINTLEGEKGDREILDDCQSLDDVSDDAMHSSSDEEELDNDEDGTNSDDMSTKPIGRRSRKKRKKKKKLKKKAKKAKNNQRSPSPSSLPLSAFNGDDEAVARNSCRSRSGLEEQIQLAKVISEKDNKLKPLKEDDPHAEEKKRK